MNLQESSKQRLERIKREGCPNTYNAHYGQTERVDDLKPGDLKWLIEQAEKAQIYDRRIKEDFCISSHKEFHGNEFEESIYRDLSDEELEKEADWFDRLWDK